LIEGNHCDMGVRSKQVVSDGMSAYAGRFKISQQPQCQVKAVPAAAQPVAVLLHLFDRSLVRETLTPLIPPGFSQRLHWKRVEPFPDAENLFRRSHRHASPSGVQQPRRFALHELNKRRKLLRAGGQTILASAKVSLSRLEQEGLKSGGKPRDRPVGGDVLRYD